MPVVNHDDFILSYKPVRRFIDGVGAGVLKYVGKDKVCVIGLGDDGIFYAEGLCVWLKKKGVDTVLTEMDYDCSGLDETKTVGRKLIAVDNDIITGTAYRDVMEKMRMRQKDLRYKDIKYAVLCDRTRLADFSVDDYTTTAGSEIVKLDSMDFKILQVLAKNGRASFAEIAEETDLTVSGAKKRVEKLIDDGVAEVRGRINIQKFYSVAALINLEVDTDKLSVLISKLQKSQMVYFLGRIYDRKNLAVGVVASDLGQINDFVKKNIGGKEEGIHNILVHIGEIPILPQSK